MSLEAFDQAVRTANNWLSDLAREIGRDDRRYAYRVLRAWLHTLRDRLPINGAAKFSAQLPELIRGMYFDGWEPSRTPVKYRRDEYIARFTAESRISAAEVAAVAPAVTRVFARRLSPGQLEEALAQLPLPVRQVVAGPQRGADPMAPSQQTAPQGAPRATESVEESAAAVAASTPEGSAEEILDELQARVDNLTEAVRVMAESLADNPMESPPPRRPGRGAQLAAEVLMTGPAGHGPSRSD